MQVRRVDIYNRRRLLEIKAGMIDGVEAPETALRRELEEEQGFQRTAN